MKKLLSIVFIIAALLPFVHSSVDAQTKSNGKTATVKGKVYREDKDHPVADADILLLDAKNLDNKDKRGEAKTDSRGDFVLEKVLEGRYIISIKAWHDTLEDVPCQWVVGTTREKNSPIVIARDKGKFVEVMYIKDVSVKAGAEIVRDFDIACISGKFRK